MKNETFKRDQKFSLEGFAYVWETTVWDSTPRVISVTSTGKF